ncbi:DMT family transporter [Nocardia sp. NPDC050793]|uniref:DMT family transporter n=1 Tax=Nocardia sp. NPDC050793 TaxID=3155159 RepID=UPI0033DE6FB5
MLYYHAVGRVGPTTATSAMFLVPAFGLTCAWAFLGESIAPLQGIGAGLMFVGAWMNTRPALDDSDPMPADPTPSTTDSALPAIEPDDALIETACTTANLGTHPADLGHSRGLLFAFRFRTGA